MSEHKATIVWQRTGETFAYEKYSRDHAWRFDNGVEVAASATPAYLGNAGCVDPEEAFVASLSSCHMLTFLAIACKKRLVVDRYEDDATGFMEKGADGKLGISRVVLRPLIAFSGDKQPSAADLEAIHHAAHENCFIANSVKTEIQVEPRGSA